MSGRLAGKVAVVTGAGSGMGRAMVTHFCAHGAKVIAADVSGKQDDLPAKLGAACHATHADVSKSADVRAMLDLAVERFGRLDVLCNNAGISGRLAPTAEQDEDDFDLVLAVNQRVDLGLFPSLQCLRAETRLQVSRSASACGRAGGGHLIRHIRA